MKEYKMGIFNNIGRYLDIQDYIKNFNQQIQSGLKLDVNNNYDIEGKRLANVGQGLDDDDAVVMHQLTSLDSALNRELSQLKADSLQVDGSSHMTGDLDLRGNKLILPGEINMNRKLIKNLDVDENDDLLAVNMVTLKKFSSSSSPLTSGDIDLQEKFNVKHSKQQSFQEMETNYDNLISYEDAKKAFLSKKETFPMETALDMGNHQIYNVKDPTVDDQGANMRFVNTRFSQSAANPTLGETDLSGEKIVNLATPTNDDDASNKKYVDDVDKKRRDQISEEVILIQNALDGKVGKGNQIDTNGARIINLGNPIGKNDAVTSKYLILQLVQYLSLNGGTMNGDLNMQQNKLIELSPPIFPADAVTKEYVDQKFISPSGSMENVFQYIMNDVNQTSSEFGITVLGILDFPQSPHLLNKKAIKFQMGLQLNDSSRYYSRLGLNMFSLPEGDYTLVVEFFPPTTKNIELDCLSTTINVNHQNNGVAGKAWKNIVQLTKYVSTPPEYLMVDMKCDVDQKSSDNVGWLIVWGVSGIHTTVPSSVFDQPFVFETGKMVMETDLDLNGKRLLNYPKSKAVIFGQYKKATDSERETFKINNETAHHVFGFDFTVKKITLHFTIRDGPIVPVNTSVMIKASSKTQSASGSDIGNNAISYSFDFAVAANEEFELSLRNRGGIARANVTILIEI